MCRSGFFVNRLTIGTKISPASMAIAPALMGDCSSGGNQVENSMLATMSSDPKAKLTQQAVRVVFFQYRPYRNGARKAPARAPQEIPMSWAIKVILLVYWISAITAEIAIKTTISRRMQKSCFFSFMFFATVSFRKSIVRVELEAITSEDRVDMDADNTKITTRAMSSGERFDNMVGMMASYPWVVTSTRPLKRRPKPPRK